MKSLLILSPRFPPTDAVDLHRVRMNLTHYAENDWAPRVLCVAPEKAGRMTVPALLETIPADTPVRRAGAAPEAVFNALGVRDLAMRAYPMLRAAGDAWIREDRPDLVFVSTTAFLAMPLAASWRRRFGVPYVLDFQDPWSATPPSTAQFHRRGAKHRVMRAVHARAEAATVPGASGLMAVSDAYLEALRAAYSQLRGTPAETIPFGYAEADFDAARRVGRPWRADGWDYAAAGGPLLLSAGRAGADMERALTALFGAMGLAAARGLAPLATLRAGFLGTGYRKTGNPRIVAPLAEARGLTDRVRERADRLPLFDALASLLAADVLLVLGSDDLAYQPSKLYQYLASGKPILCVAPSAGRLAKAVAGLDTVAFLPSDTAPTEGAVARVAARLDALLTGPCGGARGTADVEQAALFSARTLAARECALFDRALAHAGAAAGAPAGAVGGAAGGAS